MITTRTICWTSLAGLIVLLSPAVASTSQGPAPKAAAAQDAPALKDGKEKTSYAVGMNLGSVIRKDADLDVNLIVQGLRDAFSGGKLLLTDAEMRTVLNRLAADLRTRQAELRASASTANGASAERPQDRSATAAVSALAGINVAFKLDPRISKGLYMGDRWLPLPYTQVGQAKQVTVEARAEGVADQGKQVSIAPSWTATDPEMVTVTPNQGKEVTITVLRPGESSVEVSSQGVSRQFSVKAELRGETLQVEISEK